ncbi:helicase HerA-like domain-containing protein [Prevotella sp. P6B1]|uniref:helicase HerA-like domain-containing protein n=1 Tax=Prevotella sp. P6B1 TaxID=1410613 RepID=UPI00068A7AB1|nr:helicase HerA-like domain-containing protein [Prevotella sp. P6B1]
MFDKERGLYIAHCKNGALSITGKMANRHGLIAGATGTGKTVTLQVMAETFCQAGVPCFMADMKGDLSGISQAGKLSGFIEKRMPEFGIESPEFQSCPVRFFDVYGEQGHPMRATISQMGPQLLSRLLDLNETQDGVLNIVFRIADERGLLILDLKDLRAMLDYVSQHAKEYTTKYGNISSASVGAIQRALLQLENQGAEKFFGEPSFDIFDLMQTEGGKGIMNVLAADKLMMQPKLYSIFLLWLLSELYSTLPEVGDLPLPKLVFFFDEAHMLFDGSSKALLDKIEQVIRLIRSKGVGIYFITQSPTDIPENILGQLGNRVQHALRAYTPKDQKAVKTAADTFRPNPDFKTDEAIMNLETGEALVSFLDEKGAPSMVERAKILFPLSQIGAVTEGQRLDIIKQSRIYGKYDTPVDRESAFEVLMAEADRALQEQEHAEAPQPETKGKKKAGIWSKVGKAILTAITSTLATMLGTYVSDKVTGKKTKSRTSAKGRVVKNATSAATRTITKELTRDILGNLIK